MHAIHGERFISLQIAVDEEIPNPNDEQLSEAELLGIIDDKSGDENDSLEEENTTTTNKNLTCKLQY